MIMGWWRKLRLGLSRRPVAEPRRSGLVDRIRAGVFLGLLGEQDVAVGQMLPFANEMRGIGITRHGAELRGALAVLVGRRHRPSSHRLSSYGPSIRGTSVYLLRTRMPANADGRSSFPIRQLER